MDTAPGLSPGKGCGTEETRGQSPSSAEQHKDTRLSGASGQETRVLVPTLPLPNCVTLGKPCRFIICSSYVCMYVFVFFRAEPAAYGNSLTYTVA